MIWGLLIGLLVLILFVWGMFAIMAATDGQIDGENGDWTQDTRGRFTRWAYLLGRRGANGGLARKERRRERNARKREKP